ncbi:hypothetical protein [Amycolatopsis taiwanensis]|uniref:Uncharacterized protein n=1 Tax=Amycolatopsis taiwanensis TaxID=342230 RepID=A0A9W6QYU7_9PSEU|nr:hypothetical protein [Amycolatopsis taiwanensis]GLY66521.1 hypothetical protein Atai01_31400 [Amycolatopsis taiwanensis]
MFLKRLIEGGSRGWTSPVTLGGFTTAVVILAAFVTIGLTLAGLGLLALGFVHADTGYGNVWWRLTVVGVDFDLTMSPLTSAAIQAVNP